MENFEFAHEDPVRPQLQANFVLSQSQSASTVIPSLASSGRLLQKGNTRPQISTTNKGALLTTPSSHNHKHRLNNNSTQAGSAEFSHQAASRQQLQQHKVFISNRQSQQPDTSEGTGDESLHIEYNHGLKSDSERYGQYMQQPF